jgi:hypothetical protein
VVVEAEAFVPLLNVFPTDDSRPQRLPELTVFVVSPMHFRAPRRKHQPNTPTEEAVMLSCRCARVVELADAPDSVYPIRPGNTDFHFIRLQ